MFPIYALTVFSQSGLSKPTSENYRTMSVLNKKSRMVSFRLSSLEFTSAQADCERRGARSVSGLARRALLGVIAQLHSDLHSPAVGEASVGFPVDLSMDLKLEHLRIEISDLRSQLDRLRQTMLPSRDSAATTEARGSPNVTPTNMTATAS